jgi:molecular chaperone DnaK (HSP70)
MKEQYVIGIDLGTTNCTMAYFSNSQELGKGLPPPKIEQFPILQWTQQGQAQELFSLPSFLYFLLDEEQEQILPWEADKETLCVGEFAKQRGAEVVSRVVSSAKSWLSHASVDRRSKLLPLCSEQEDSKISPVEVTKHLLKYLKNAWNEAMEDAPFESQKIIVTVPASFDPDARQLVEEAAKEAGYPQDMILMEEPLAAFYSWLQQHEDSWREHLTVGDQVLVADIGGGTTDFTLISVEQKEGNLELERVAVGNHLLLGGDNMDLTLAYAMRMRFEEEGHDIDQWQMQHLIHQCRQAKELLLSKEAEEMTITIQGQGSGLIGGAISVVLEREEAFKILVEGFFPVVEPSDQSSIDKHIGIQEIGLPYAKDPRITSQLAKFLSMTGEHGLASTENFVQPSAILVNGGSLKATAFQTRLEETLNHWAKEFNKPDIQVLQGHDLDYGVSRGAVYYGLARQGNAIRVKGGISKNYFVGVEEMAPAVPGMEPPMKALCVAPLGMEEGSESLFDSEMFTLAVGQPSVFRFFSKATTELTNGDKVVFGTTIKRWKKELTELHSIETQLVDEVKDEEYYVRVKLKSKVTELGVLQLWCVAEDGRQWKLEFDVRQEKQQLAGV